jgi:hypothetical protein
LFGGSGPKQDPNLSDCWSTVDGIDWQKEVSVAAWTLSAQTMSVSFAGRMWRMGGFLEKNRPISEIWSSVDGRIWTLASAAAAWQPRGGGALVVHNGKLWLLGGTRHPHNEGDHPALNDVWCTENGVDWTQVNQHAPWQPRGFHSAVAHNGRLWILGGGLWEKNATLYKDVWSSFDGVSWVVHSTQSEWPGRVWATSASYEGLLWIIGGFIDHPRGGTNDIWYSADGSNWYPYLSGKTWPARMAHSTVVFNGRLWLLAGSNGDYFNDVWALRIEEDELIPGSTWTGMVKWFYKFFRH